MMKPYQYIRSLILAFAILSFSACSNDDYLQQTMGENVSVTFRPTLNGELSTRSIGDATGIDRLTVAVYEGSQTLSKKFSFSEDWDIVQRNGITLTLIEGHSYKILFWAEDEDNSAYSLTDDGRITVDYNNYINGGFAKMEELDAFCGTSSVTIGALKVEDKGEIKLSRPLAQVNFADNATKPISGAHKAIVTYHGLPTSFNPFTGEIGMSENDINFTFEDFPEAETLFVNVNDSNNEYYYISSNYVFAAPQSGTTATIKATLDLQNVDGTSIKEVELDGITIEQNKKTNILGSIVQQPETWSVWNGTIPTSSTITTDDQNRYIIDEADDVAWLSVKENAQSLAPNSTFIMTVDVDMDNGSGLSAIQLPSGSTLDGDGHTIKGLQLGNALLGNVTDITVKNLTIEETTVANTSADVTHVGVLVNTLKGSNTFSNIHIKSSSVSTQNGAAGGIVGYISRKDPNNRGETLTVTFDDCHVTETTIDGTHSEGHFVGLLRGYDYNETLQFNSNCTLTLSATVRSADNFVSPYREGNEGTWLADNDYSKYDGWLGNEECYRGTVMYGDNRFVPCWDGVTKITPLTDGTTKLIYSAFDLASLQGTAAGNIKLMENVDMEHDLDGASKYGVRNHIFKALSTLTKLDGNGNTIYNITIRDNYYGGFVKNESCATTFENVTFDGADIRVTHDTEEGNAYVGTLRGFAYAATTINNVHVKNGYLNGVCKIGGLCGGIFSKITCSNSSVSNYSIENYDSKIVDEGFKANGEIGGLIGYITVLDANTVNEISNCTVSDNNFTCVTYSASLWDRSVAPFIGDIRTQQAGTVRINNCEILGTNTYINASNGKTASFDQHRKQTGGSLLRPTYTYYPLVGQCYRVIFLDKQGKVYIDNTQIF